MVFKSVLPLGKYCCIVKFFVFNVGNAFSLCLLLFELNSTIQINSIIRFFKYRVLSPALKKILTNLMANYERYEKI